MISAIIVAFNEEDWINSIIDELEKQTLSNFEIILADGGSTDQTFLLAKQRGTKIFACPKGKALQMNEAAKKANGEILFFVHADMQFPENTLSIIYECVVKNNIDGGGFANVFDKHNNKIKRLGTWLNFRFFDNREQSDKGIFYRDNGIFVKKRVFETLGGLKKIPIMEDYDFSLRMNSQFQTQKIYKPCITVSARRHEKSDFLKTRLQWIFIRKLYKWGLSPFKLANWYKDVR